MSVHVSAALTLPSDLSSVSRARRALSALVPDNEAVDDGRLLLSEAMANAVEHTDGPVIRVLIGHDRAAERLFCAVHDNDAQVPDCAARPADKDAESGRGLHLIEALSDAWGHLVRPDGKWTWFSLSATSGAA